MKTLDIPDSMFEEAERKYKLVGEWLGKEDSDLVPYAPDIYPQGSFALGTVIHPISDTDEYDVDLVCELQLTKTEVSQQGLKKKVGDRLKANKTYEGMLEEGRRCWTLQYADSAKFHMDILPAIPDPVGSPKSIAITDKDLKKWCYSNPRGYAAWFWAKMREIAEHERQVLAEALKVNIAEVPDWRVKTPLQRAIQLLKRHRDLFYKGNEDDKPISIIITTLAARAYRGEADLYNAVIGLVSRMPSFIEDRDGVRWVPNPVNDKENFADKWQSHPQREAAFKKWLIKVREDLSSAMVKRGLNEVADVLRPCFGVRAVNEAMEKYGEALHESRTTGKMRMGAGGIIGTSGDTPVKGHTFFGDNHE